MKHKEQAETHKIVMGRRYRIDTSERIEEYKLFNTVEIYRTKRGNYFIRVVGHSITPLQFEMKQEKLNLEVQDRYYEIESEIKMKQICEALSEAVANHREKREKDG